MLEKIFKTIVYNKTKNRIVATDKKSCKYCGGGGWHNSNVGKRMIKCPRCSGTGCQKAVSQV